MKIKNLLKSKKGDFQSLVIGIAILFGLVLTVIIFSKVFLSVLSEFKQQPEFSNNTIQTIEKVESKTIPYLDFFIFFTLIAIMIGLIIASIYIDVHPAIVVIFIVAFIIAVFLSGIFAKVYTDFSSEEEISSIASQFTYSNLIFNNFPIIISVLGIIIIVVLYGKSRKGTPV